MFRAGKSTHEEAEMEESVLVFDGWEDEDIAASNRLTLTTV